MDPGSVNVETLTISLPVGGLSWAPVSAGLWAQQSGVLAWSREASLEVFARAEV